MPPAWKVPTPAKLGEAGEPIWTPVAPPSPWKPPPHGNPRRPQNLGRQARRCGLLGPAKPMPAAGMETSDARKTWGGRRADVDSCGPAKPMQTAAASKAGRDRRADVGNSGAVKLMKIAAAKAAVESAAGKPGGDGRGAGVEIGRRMNAACAKVTKPWTTAEGRKRRRADRRRAPAAEAARTARRDKRGLAPGDAKRRRRGDDGAGSRAAKVLRLKGPIQPKPSFHSLPHGY